MSHPKYASLPTSPPVWGPKQELKELAPEFASQYAGMRAQEQQVPE